MSAYAKATAAHTTLTLPELKNIAYDTFHPNSSIIIKFKDDVERDKVLGGTYSIISGEISWTHTNELLAQYDLNARNIILLKEDE